VAVADRPPVEVTHYSFDLMVGLGVGLVALAGWALWRGGRHPGAFLGSGWVLRSTAPSRPAAPLGPVPGRGTTARRPHPGAGPRGGDRPRRAAYPGRGLRPARPLPVLLRHRGRVRGAVGLAGGHPAPAGPIPPAASAERTFVGEDRVVTAAIGILVVIG